MLKQLRWRFTKVAVASISIVLLILAFGINVINYINTRNSNDRLLDFIAENEGTFPGNLTPHLNNKYEHGFRMTPETPFETRYFTVTVDNEGNIIRGNMEHIASVDKNTMNDYVSAALLKSSSRGRVDGFRFLKKARDDGSTLIVFLDISKQKGTELDLMQITAIVMIFAILATFGIGYLLSKQAVASTVRSIENQKRFITDASHEMKTPITAISAYASVLDENYPDNEWIEGLEKETDRLGELVKDLVELSRWDEGAPMTNAKKFSLTDALWDVATPYKNIAVAKHRELIININDEIEITGDENAIQRAVSTLLENAINYSPENTDIFIRAFSNKKGALIEVQNNCDVKEELDLDKLFERFYRPDSSRTRTGGSGGNGVGLSVAKAIVEAHGGSIKARYENGDSIVFTIKL